MQELSPFTPHPQTLNETWTAQQAWSAGEAVPGCSWARIGRLEPRRSAQDPAAGWVTGAGPAAVREDGATRGTEPHQPGGCGSRKPLPRLALPAGRVWLQPPGDQRILQAGRLRSGGQGRLLPPDGGTAPRNAPCVVTGPIVATTSGGPFALGAQSPLVRSVSGGSPLTGSLHARG